MDASARLLGLINGYRVSQAVYVAARLGLADHLADEPMTIAGLASTVGCDGPALRRLVRGLVAVEVLAELDDGRIALAPLGQQLRSDAPGKLGDWAGFVGRPSTWQAWGALEHSVRTGQNAFVSVHGRDVWQFRAEDPAEGQIFDAAMTAIANNIVEAMLAAYDFSGIGSVADIGGGHGALLAALLTRYPAMKGILFDQPHVVAGAAEPVRLAGVADRCEIVGGDFFAAVPSNVDAYLVKSVVHDWPDEQAIAILRSCRAAMKPSSKILLIERVISGPPYLLSSVMSDLNMLVGPGGQERSEDEYARLLIAAGLKLSKAIPTDSGFWIVEAKADN
ncbi:methyltransferase [Rhizocola hellebori]|uniref:Methyltransferase n=1 Tax=Rhizocola hellebori TaxID=1392758 RepID=A0A8J3VE66_9ACTN|nr:methyltransferase [Rhizocola hellebori]GIH03041.1 methyltransferase [Rhizocola hellebori]